MFTSFQKDPQVFMQWNWDQFKPYADDLARSRLSAETIAEWLMDWSDINRMVAEKFARLWVKTTQDTADQEAKQRFTEFLDDTYTPSQAANQVMKQKLLASGLQPVGFDVALRNMQVEAEIYREENLPLLTEERKLENEYDGVIGAQTVTWEGEEITTTRLQPVYQGNDRNQREKAWRLEMGRKLVDRERLNDIWVRMMDNRERLAAQAGFKDYRAFRWKELLRFDYTPEDCMEFHRAIKQVVVPAAVRMYEKRRAQLGLNTLRPWDLAVDPLGRDPLKPFRTIAELEEKVANIFHKVDPELGANFETMRREGLLDLENRVGKAPGAYCADYDMVMLPFIFENAVGLNADVSTLIHEGGHAMHIFEEAHLPYYHQLPVGMEIAEVASMAMELLASPYLVASEGGFYSEQEAARAIIEHLEEQVLFWPYMAVVDSFQHWVYTHLDQARDPIECDGEWGRLWGEFMSGVDWSDLDEIMVSGWQRKQHIFEAPFYYIEYGMASQGALQVWANALKDQKGTVAAYRRALSLGGTATLPVLYATAGARFKFDAATLQEAVSLVEGMIEKLEDV